MLSGGAECTRTQVEDDISHRTHDQTPPHPVQSPQADSNPHQSDSHQCDLLKRGLVMEQIHHAADNNRQSRANEGEDNYKDGSEYKLFNLRSEEVSNTAREFTVAILTVIFFVV